MKILKHCYFKPLSGVVDRYYDNGGFSGDDSVSVSSLTEQQQAIVGAAMQWALSQLPEGFVSVSQVIVEKLPDVVTEVSEWGEAIAFSPSFTSSITGSNKDQEGATKIVNSIPGPETEGLALLWSALQASLK